MKFDVSLLHIKTPQLIGICLGVIVFIVTITFVIYVLCITNTLQNAVKEISDDISSNSKSPSKSDNNKRRFEEFPKSSSSIPPQFTTIPELYDHLLLARKKLSSKPKNNFPIEPLKGKSVLVRPINLSSKQDILELYEAGNGSAIFHESEYDSARLWGFFDLLRYSQPINDDKQPESKLLHSMDHLKSLSAFESFIKNLDSQNDSNVFVIVDIELRRVIGMFLLTDNSPANLSIRIDLFWMTVAFQGSRRSHEAMYLIIDQLFSERCNYRRLVVNVDQRNIIACKFLMRCTFTLEATLRKHLIIYNRNVNTAVFVMLNSDWFDTNETTQKKLLRYCGLETVEKKKQLMNVNDTLFDLAQIPINDGKRTSTGGKSKRKKHKKLLSN